MTKVEIAAVKVVRETGMRGTLLALLVTNLTAVMTTTGTIEAMWAMVGEASVMNKVMVMASKEKASVMMAAKAVVKVVSAGWVAVIDVELTMEVEVAAGMSLLLPRPHARASYPHPSRWSSGRHLQ